MLKEAKPDPAPQQPPPSVDRRSGGIYIKDGKLVVGGNVAGRDMTVINLPPLTWFVPIAIVVPALVVAAVIWIPQLQGPGPMTGTFNIAVARFGSQDAKGQIVPTADKTDLSERIFKQLQDEFQAAPNLGNLVQIRHLDEIVRGSTQAEKEASARRLAESVNAHLLIYGNYATRGNEMSFAPEFYVDEKKVEGIKGAEEIVGPSQLGKPVPCPGSCSGLAGSIELGKALQSRTQALTFFTIGLAYLVAGDRPNSIAWFQKAAGVEGWEDEQGKEVLYLFLGTAYNGSQAPADWEKGRAAFQTALQLNPEYARPYIGLGNFYYAEFARSDPKDMGMLDLAQAQYEKARVARDKPAAAYVEAKVHISLANVYTIKGQLAGADWYSKAETEYLQVVNDYERGNTGLKPFVGQCYYSLGHIEERGRHDLARAAEYYQKTIAVTDDNKDLQRQAQSQLLMVQSALGTPTPK